MALYEHVFLARQDVSTQQVETMTKEFTDIIEAGGGKIAKSEYWGLKTLNFKIKKNRKAHYGLLNIDAPPAAVAEMERRMSLSTDILRFLTVKVEAHETEPSAPMRKGDRDERGDRGDRGDRGPRGGGGGRFGDRDRGGGGGDRGGFRGDRPPRDGDGPRGPRPPREGDGFRADGPRGDRPPRDGDGFRGPRGPRPDGPRSDAPRPPRAPESES
jgi:small subunit ribosomal protein S6